MLEYPFLKKNVDFCIRHLYSFSFFEFIKKRDKYKNKDLRKNNKMRTISREVLFLKYETPQRLDTGKGLF
jgi:hypothetical protein